METLIIEPDIDLEEEEETNWSTSDAQISSIQHNEREGSISTPIIPSQSNFLLIIVLILSIRILNRIFLRHQFVHQNKS